MKKNFFLWFLMLILLTTYIDHEQSSSEGILSVKNIEIIGTKNSDELEISKKLIQVKGKNLFFLQKKEFDKVLKGTKFIKNFKVKKVYPDKIKLIIEENKPIGIFFDENKRHLLLEEGEIIKNYNQEKFRYLPLVYGKMARKFFFKFYSELEKTNFEMKNVKQFYYHDSNRWDILLIDKKFIKLPEENYVASVREFMNIYNKEKFKKFTVFDFRIKNKLILK